MTEPKQTVAGTFVEPRGMIRSLSAAAAGREVLGLVGSVAASAAATSGLDGASPLESGQIAYLSLDAQHITMFRAKRGAFRPKATDEVLARASRREITSASLAKGRLGGVLEIGFSDGQSWTFDIAKVHRSGAEGITAALDPRA
jgi:hypothetical protein